jgi:hypothetical protein
MTKGLTYLNPLDQFLGLVLSSIDVWLSSLLDLLDVLFHQLLSKGLKKSRSSSLYLRLRSGQNTSTASTVLTDIYLLHCSKDDSQAW